MGLIFVDVDGTLLECSSSEREFFFHLMSRGVLRRRQVLSAMRFLRHRRRQFGWNVFRKNKAYLSQLDVAQISALAQAFVHKDLLGRLRRNVVQRIEQHQRQGDVVTLLTGTPDFIAGPLAEALGFDMWRATRCAERAGVFVDEPPEAHPFGEEKVHHALDMCAHTGIDISESVAYANSAKDIPLLRKVGRAVAVNPDRGLVRAARVEGWEILSGRGRLRRRRGSGRGGRDE